MRLIIKNLPPNIQPHILKSHFSTPSPPTDISLPKDKTRNFCFIGYKTHEDALKAQKHFHKSYFKNYRLIVEPLSTYDTKLNKLNKLLNKESVKFVNDTILKIVDLPECTLKDLKQIFKNAKSISLKNDTAIIEFKTLEDSKNAQENKVVMGKRVKYLKNVIEDNQVYYNSLFFDFSTVIKRICEDEKLEKSDVVNLKDESLGARIAILESHLVDQTRKWLESNFIDISGSERDKKTLLIRNFDLLNNLEGLEKGSVKISPSKVMAIVKFENEGDAMGAYKKFCMKRVHDKAIYCEFLPIKEQTNDNVKTESITEEKKKEKSTNKICIKNVPFQASEDDIRKLIESQTKIKNIRMPKKRDGNKRGFCFVEVDDKETVKFVCEYFGKSTHLYGRSLVFLPADK